MGFTLDVEVSWTGGLLLVVRKILKTMQPRKLTWKRWIEEGFPTKKESQFTCTTSEMLQEIRQSEHWGQIQLEGPAG